MADLLREHALTKASAPALVDDDRVQSWAVTNARVNQLISSLQASGLKPGEHVCLMARNGIPWWEVTVACLQAGWVCTPVNWHWQAEELAYVLDDAGARLLFVSREFLDVARAALSRLDDPRCALVVLDAGETVAGEQTYAALLEAGSEAEPADASYGTRPMMYTSGTTGRPKGVLNQVGLGTAQEITQGASGFVAMMGMAPGATTLIAGPAYHSAQWSFALLPFLSGSTLVTPSRCDAADILKQVDAHDVANVHLVPTQFVRLLRLGEEERRAFRGTSLRTVAHGGAPCAPSVKRAMIDWWGPVVVEYYGGTETGMATWIGADEWLERPGSVGRPIPGAEIEIVDAESGTPCGPGQPGVIWVRREGADFAYHGDSEKTAGAHDARGFGSTGDVGYLDEDGYLYISDRIADMIISGGVNIYPAQVEDVLHEHPRVLDVAVLGVPDEEFGERVSAVVAVDSTRQEAELAEELTRYCRSRIAAYMCPREFHFVDSVPRNAAGKLLKREMRQTLLAKAETKTKGVR